MSTTTILPYGRHAIDEADIEAVAAVLRGDWLTQGPHVAEFESALSATFGADHAIAVNSGTAALHVGMLAMGIGPGDLVIVPPLTFVASANAALYCGAEVAFVDVEPGTGLIDVDALDAFLRGYRGAARPRAVVAVHYAGLPCDMRALDRVCSEHGIELIEDACHAPGATWRDARGVEHRIGDGAVSTFAALSFHPVKHFTTGEGGAVMTARADLADRARMMRTHGITRAPDQLRENPGPWWYEMHALGFNYRMPDVLAALGTSQLRKTGPWLAHRRELAALYRERFADVPEVTVQALRPDRTHAYHLFPVLVEGRDRVHASLREQGIYAQVHYIPVHVHPYYVQRYGPQSFPNAERFYDRVLSLPLFHTMDAADVDRTVQAVALACADG